MRIAGAAKWTVVALIAIALIAAAPAAALNVQVVNSSRQPASNIYLMLEKGSSSDGQLPDEVGIPLSQIKNSTFSLGALSSGRLYISYGAPVTVAEPPAAQTRYDKIELSNPGVADVTAVDFFGIPTDLQSLDASGATVGDAVGYRCYTATVLQHLRPIGAAAEVTNAGQFVRFLSPQLASEGSFPSLAPYVASMTGHAIEVNDEFLKKTISYKGTFEPGGSITLTGTITTAGKAEPGATVRIEGSTLPQGVYSGNGAYTVNGEAADVSQNNEYSTIYRDVVAGFGLGYWGGRYGNNTANWLHQPNFAAARLGSSPFPAYSLYASTIAEYSTAYGYAFSELGPDEVTVPLGSSVATMRLTIDPDQGPAAPGCIGESTAPVAPSQAPTPAVGAPPGAPTAAGLGQVKVTIDTSLAKLDKRGRALLTLSCSGDPCHGELALEQVLRTPAKRRRDRRGPKARRASRAVHHAPPSARKVIVLGHIVFAVEEGKRQSMWVTISPAGRRAIHVANGHRLSVLAEALVGPRNASTVVGSRKLTLESYASPPRKRRRTGR
ncbi:MAG TPA: hypothetical protein VGF47_03280 [Solirubrobacteraceae bacterium]|jgi:hypothetical protein